MRLLTRLFAAVALFAIIGLPQANAQQFGSGAWNAFPTASISPTATAAAIGTVEQTFTVLGLVTTMDVFTVGPAPTALCPLVGSRVSAANTIQLDFAVMTAAACTPAPGVYNVIARTR
jgi:hypothetical protein